MKKKKRKKLTSDFALAHIPPPCRHPFPSSSRQTWCDDDREELLLEITEGGAQLVCWELRTNMAFLLYTHTRKKKLSGGDTLSFSCFKNTMQLRLSWKAGCPYRTGWVTGMFKVNRGGKQVWLSVMSNMERWAERNVRPKYAWKSQCRHKESTLVKPHSTTSYIITASGLANLYASLICASNW